MQCEHQKTTVRCMVFVNLQIQKTEFKVVQGTGRTGIHLKA